MRRFIYANKIGNDWKRNLWAQASAAFTAAKSQNFSFVGPVLKHLLNLRCNRSNTEYILQQPTQAYTGSALLAEQTQVFSTGPNVTSRLSSEEKKTKRALKRRVEETFQEENWDYSAIAVLMIAYDSSLLLPLQITKSLSDCR